MESTHPDDANEHCPGTDSDNAGKSSACAGCPNQGICSSGEAKVVDTDVPIVKDKLSNVKHKLIVLSGKGGVGKTTVSAMIARAFALDSTKNIAVLDVDICGPSIPRVFGCESEQIHQSGSGWSPVYVEENLAVMSIGFLLPNREEAVIWRGPRKNGMIKQFLRDVDWTDVDYLVIDTPPGTSDEHMSLVEYLKGTNVDGAIIVTTPQELSLLDVRKEITFCRKVGLPILGVIENMSGFVCPCCKTKTDIFEATTGGAQEMCKVMNVRLLGKIPLEPLVRQCCDSGVNYLVEHESEPTAQEYRNIVQRICDVIAEKEAG